MIIHCRLFEEENGAYGKSLMGGIKEEKHDSSLQSIAIPKADTYVLTIVTIENGHTGESSYFVLIDPRMWPLGHKVGLWNGFVSVRPSV